MPNTHKLIRTELERQIRERNMTYEEFVEYAERFARDHNEPATLSLRHLQRLASGRSAGGRPISAVRPPTARLLERMLSHSITKLLGPPISENTLELDSLLEEARGLGSDTLQSCHELLDNLRERDRTCGAASTYRHVCSLAKKLDMFRSHSLCSTMRLRLSALQSEVCTLAGWQALDMGKTVQAWGHYERAVEIASPDRRNQDHDMYARVEQAFVLLDLGRIEDALGWLKSIRHSNGSPAMQLWYWMTLSESYAVAGDVKQCKQSLDRATRFVGVPSQSSPNLALARSHLDRWQGRVLALSDDQEAPKLLTQAASEIGKTYTRALYSLYADLALSHISNDKHRALRFLEKANKIGRAIESVRIHARCELIGKELGMPIEK